MGDTQIIILIIAVVLVGLMLVTTVVSAFYLAHHLAWPKHFTTEETIKIEKDKHLYYDYDKLEKEEFDTKSFDGYEIKGTYVKNDPKKFVIISHGYTYTRYGGLKYLNLFYNLGYSCIIFDQRGHGENAPYKCTMGLTESKDLIEIINHVHKRFGDDIYLGLHGESMGAGTQIYALRYHPKVDFVVNDCGYGIYKDVIEQQSKQIAHFPKWLVGLSGKVSKLLYGYNFCKLRPIYSLKDSDVVVPILFVHGDNDTLVNCRQSQLMYDAYHGEKQIQIFKGSKHAQSFQDDAEHYNNVVRDFLEKIKKEKN